MKRWRSVLAFVFVCVAVGGLRAQEPIAPSNRCGELHEALQERGLPVSSVRYTEGQYDVILHPAATAAQRAEAEHLKADLLSRPPAAIVVDNLQDALVVIRFEPGNPSANRVLRDRYKQLKTAARPR